MIAASWDDDARCVVLRLGTCTHDLAPQAARGVRDGIDAALRLDPDPTPRSGMARVTSVHSAWMRFKGDMVHGSECPAKPSERTLEARMANRACECGLRDLVVALGDS